MSKLQKSLKMVPLKTKWHCFGSTPGTILAPPLELLAYKKVKNGSRDGTVLKTAPPSSRWHHFSSTEPNGTILVPPPNQNDKLSVYFVSMAPPKGPSRSMAIDPNFAVAACKNTIEYLLQCHKPVPRSFQADPK